MKIATNDVQVSVLLECSASCTFVFKGEDVFIGTCSSLKARWLGGDIK